MEVVIAGEDMSSLQLSCNGAPCLVGAPKQHMQQILQPEPQVLAPLSTAAMA